MSPEYRAIFTSFRNHFKDEAKALGDSTLGKDLDVIEFLSTFDRSGRMK